jgi:hypothetical protein
MSASSLPTLIRSGERAPPAYRVPNTFLGADDTRVLSSPQHSSPRDFNSNTSPGAKAPQNGILSWQSDNALSQTYQYPGSNGTGTVVSVPKTSPFWSESSPTKRSEEASSVTASLHYLSPSQNPTSPMTSPVRIEPRGENVEPTAYTVSVDPIVHQGSRTFYEISVTFQGMEQQKVQKVREHSFVAARRCSLCASDGLTRMCRSRMRSARSFRSICKGPTCLCQVSTVCTLLHILCVHSYVCARAQHFLVYVACMLSIESSCVHDSFVKAFGSIYMSCKLTMWCFPGRVPQYMHIQKQKHI